MSQDQSLTCKVPCNSMVPSVGACTVKCQLSPALKPRLSVSKHLDDSTAQLTQVIMEHYTESHEVLIN